MTQVLAVQATPWNAEADAFVAFCFKDSKGLGGLAAKFDRRLGGSLSELVRLGDFSGKPKEAAFVPTRGALGSRRVLLLGLGPRKEFGQDALREAGARAATLARERKLRALALPVHTEGLRGGRAEDAARLLTEGTLLGLFGFKEYQTGRVGSSKDSEDPKRDLRRVVLVADSPSRAAAARKGVREGRILAESTNVARRLIMMPSSAKPPPALARMATQEARRHGVRVQVLTKQTLRAKGLGGLLGVAAGSVHEPRLVILESRPRSKRTVLLVGKGITFDSGGINIKPSEGLDRMRYDMAGSATVLAVVLAAARLNFPHRVVGLMPLAENMPSGSALHPGDILTMHDGTTVEVGNTDAEGRLVLADALSYGVDRFKPNVVVDVATLTGAIRTALGTITTGVLGSDDRLVRQLIEAGKRTGDDLWPLPLNRQYEQMVESDVADLRNIGPGHGGAITAAAFLKHFTKGVPWAHLDIAGTCWTEKGPGDLKKEYLPKGATGIGVRLLAEFLRSYK